VIPSTKGCLRFLLEDRGPQLRHLGPRLGLPLLHFSWIPLSLGSLSGFAKYFSTPRWAQLFLWDQAVIRKSVEGSGYLASDDLLLLRLGSEDGSGEPTKETLMHKLALVMLES